MNKSVLLVSCVYPPEPVVSAHLSYDLCNALGERIDAVKVLHPRPTRPNGFQFETMQTLEDNEVVLKSYTCSKSLLLGRFVESFSFGKHSYRYIQQHHNEIDVIYANTWPLFAQYYLSKAAKKYGIPYYIHVQDIYPESYCHKMPKIMGKILFMMLAFIDKYILRNAAGVFAISPTMRSYLSQSRGIDDSKIFLVRNWQDDKSYIEAYKPIASKQEQLNVMYLGSINPTANVSLLIKSFARLNRNKFRLSIIGNGPDKDNCQALVNQLGIEVSFDSVTLEEVANKQGEADILVLCLKKGVAQTATPSKLTAYMLTGRPIIVSVDLESDCANIIREAGCGIVVEPENEMALAEAIKFMAKKDVEELNKLGKSAQDYAKKYLSRDSNLKIIVDKLIM